MSFLATLKENASFTGKDGKEYTLAPLTIKDLGKFVSWVKFKPYRDAEIAGVSSENLEKIYQDCKKGKIKEEVAEGQFEEFDIHIQSSVVISAMNSIDGIAKLLELSLAKHHSLVNIEDIIDEETLITIQAEILRVNFGEPEKNLQNPNQ